MSGDATEGATTTPDRRLRVFVSSTLRELAPEREVVRKAIEALHLTPVMFEVGARPHPPRTLYRSYLDQSDVFVGVYWQHYGRVAAGEEVSGLEDEYRLAARLPQLIYVKEPAPGREEALADFLTRIQREDRISYKRFSSPEELASLVEDDLAVLLSERFLHESTGGAPELPTGTVTFLFTDIEGSTRLLHETGAAYPALLETHRRLVREGFAAHGGREVDTQGDSFFVAFARAGDAVAAAAQIQRALATYPWPTRPVRVRMGLHSGEASTVGGGYVGLEVHRAARIAAVAHGGQVVLSDTTAALVSEALPEWTALRDLGQHRLKDFTRPARLYQLDVAGLSTEFPPLLTLERRGRAPSPLGSFVGRQHEVDELTRLLLADDVRLVTLTGPGGIGKTRLALQVATDVESSFRDGAAVVMLAPVRNPSLVVPTITQVLGLPETSGRSQLDVLIDYVTGCQLLLVLDNFEQVIESAPTVAEILQAGTGLKVLVTSRQVLRVSGEREFQVPPLGLSGNDDRGHSGLSEAVQLFVDRATAVRHDFRLTGENADVVAQICRRLDGLPLAIELAAARVRLMPPEVILSKLDRQLSLLTGGPRDLPERQRTLRSTIAWSYDLLDAAERQLLERLAVFAGGCSLEAAEVVCAEDEVGDVFEGISSLVEKSLLRAQGVVADEPRFTMLQTVREFALERLEQRGVAEEVRRRHADFFLALARRSGQALLTREQDVWLDRLAADYDNLRTAMRWCLDSGHSGRAARLGGGLWPFWWEQGRMLEGMSWMEEALRAEPVLSPEERADATVALGVLAFGWGDYERALPALGRAQELCREVGDWFGTGFSLALTGVIIAVGGDPVTGEATLDRALEAFGRIGHLWGTGFARYTLGRVLLVEGRLDEANKVLEQSVSDFREVGEKQLLTLSLLNFAWARLSGGDVRGAKDALTESLRLAIVMRHNKIDAARVLEGFAAVAAAAGDAVRGAMLFGAAEGVRRSAGAGVWVPDLPTHERTDQALRAALGADAYAARLVEGARLSLEDAAELAAGL